LDDPVWREAGDQEDPGAEGGSTSIPRDVRLRCDFNNKEFALIANQFGRRVALGLTIVGISGPTQEFVPISDLPLEDAVPMALMGNPPPGCWLLPDETCIRLGPAIPSPPRVPLERRDWVSYCGSPHIVWGTSGSWITLVTPEGLEVPKFQGRSKLRITADSLLNAWDANSLRLLDLESTGRD
jgi:hypothetical protein